MNLTRLQGWVGSQAWAARLPKAVSRRQSTSPRGQQPVAGTTRLPEPPGPAKAWDAARRPANKRAVAPAGAACFRQGAHHAAPGKLGPIHASASVAGTYWHR